MLLCQLHLVESLVREVFCFVANSSVYIVYLCFLPYILSCSVKFYLILFYPISSIIYVHFYDINNAGINGKSYSVIVRSELLKRIRDFSCSHYLSAAATLLFHGEDLLLAAFDKGRILVRLCTSMNYLLSFFIVHFSPFYFSI